jgi:hypothetical protein
MSPTGAPVKPATSPSEPQLKPPAERFWRKYSPHYEFPISTVATVAVHVAAIALIIYIVTSLLQQQETVPPVPIRGVELSLDNSGDGGEAGGRGNTPEEANDQQPARDPERQIPEEKLDKYVVSASAWVLDLKDNKEALEAIAKSVNFEKMNDVNEDAKRVIGKSFTKRGDGDGKGSGNAGGSGKGAGPAADTSGSRSSRWIITFKTSNGQDYLRQLAAFEAKLLIPQPPDWKKNLQFDDLTTPNAGKPQSDDLPTMYFIDSDPRSASKVARALGLNFDPPRFIAFFPKKVEEELAAKEREKRNLREDQIQETTFRVVERDGKYEIWVTDQVPLRK